MQKLWYETFIDQRLNIEPQAIQLNLSSEFVKSSKIAGFDKNAMKIDNLPRNEQHLELIKNHVPLFTCASEEDFKDLLVTLRNYARIKMNFLVMMLLSSLVASFGLFLNSAAVIIGAMILAPLMGPILSLAMALLRRDSKLLFESLKTIFSGILVAVTTSAFMALIVPIGRLTSEMAGRIQPSLLDLGVAIAAGTAGAYANTQENITGSLPGVAIAVALVPPLCVAGIGLGWLNMDIFSGAMLLFLTNLIGIALASSLTFMALGFAPIVKARLGIGISLLLLVIIGFPLSASFNDFHQRWLIEREIRGEKILVNGKSASLQDLEIISLGKELVLRGFVSSSHRLERKDLLALKEVIKKRINRDIKLELAIRESL